MSVRGPRPHRRRGAGLSVLLGGLALGALLLPFGLAFVTRPLLAAQAPRVPVARLELLRRELEAAIVLGEGGLAAAEGYSPPVGLGLVIEDARGEIVLSTIPSLEPGSRTGLGSIAAALPKERDLKDFFFESIRSGGAYRGRYYAWFTNDYVAKAPRPMLWVPIALMALGSLAFALGVVVAARLGRDVLKLKGAAGRIAAGDLESEVRVAGIREIEDLSLAMDGMRAALKEDKDRRARFLAAVSHDLRTPLTSIGGYLEAVEDGLASDPATLERYVSIMRDKTRVLEGRIAGLIEFAKMGSAEWRGGFEPLELGRFLASLALRFREDASLMGRAFSSELSSASGLRVLGDRDLLERAFENLFSNALRYSPDGSPVRLAARSLGGGAVAIDLDDRGPGIPPAERSRVFEPFARGSAARRGEGSGLGLYIARSVFEGHGWTVEAADAPGGGARISVVVVGEPGDEA